MTHLIPYPFGDPVAIGGILILIPLPLLVATKYQEFRKHIQNVRNFQFAMIICILIGVVLYIFALISLRLIYLTHWYFLLR